MLSLSQETCHLVLHASYLGISYQHSISILTCAYEFLRYFIGHFAAIMESKWAATWKEKKQAVQHCRAFFLTVVFYRTFLCLLIILCVKRGLFLSSGGRIKNKKTCTPSGLVAEWVSVSGPGAEARFAQWWASDVRCWSIAVIIYRVFVLRTTVTLQYVTLLKLTFV